MGFFARLGLAFGLFVKLLFDSALAGRARGLLAGAPAEPEPRAPDPEPERNPTTPALQLLAALQREGRLVDFAMDDVVGASDEEVGGVARMVHAGCRKVITSWFAPAAAHEGEEGARVVVGPGFDRARIRLVGNVTGAPPFSGALVHPGWCATKAELPASTGAADPMVLAPAEVEL